MADNTTTYTAVIDVDTTSADKSLGNLEKSTEEASGGFTRLQLRIRETNKQLQQAAEAGDKTSFKKLKGELEELEDQLEAVQLGAGKFDDVLSGLPGPAGKAGGAIKALDGGFKLLAANPVVAVIGLLGGLFLALRESLSKTAEGQAVLNKISEAFGKILGPIFAIIESVALPIFTKFAEVLGFVAEQFGKFANLLGISQDKIEEASRNSSEVLKEAYDNDLELQKKAEEDKNKLLEENAKKRLDAIKKEQEERKRILQEAEGILLEAQLSLLSERDRVLKEREMRFQSELKKLKLAGVKDLTAFEEEYRIDVLEINKKFDDIQLKQKEDAIKQEEELKKKAFQDEKARLDELAKMESQARADKIARLFAEYEYDNTLRAQSFEQELDLFDKTRDLERQELVAQQVSGDALLAFDKATAAARIQIERAQQETKLAIVSDALGVIAEAVGKESVAGKALAISQALINTFIGATKALATYPPPFGAIAAGTVIAAGLLQVNAIRKQKIPSMPKPGGGSVQGSSSSASISAPSIGSITPPNIQGGGGISPSQQISQTIAQASGKPVEAFVVSTRISSQQALDRRTNSAATFG
jgi:hypothetical protein